MVKPLMREGVHSVLGDIPKPVGYSPENPALDDPAQAGMALDHLQGFPNLREL